MNEPELFGERYQIEAPIGEGGMAEVFRAHDTRLNRTVALKILREQFTNEPEFVERFRQEARLAAGLAHPNIVGVYDVGVDYSLHYMVMEYVEGENLKMVIAREAPMSVNAIIPLLRQLAAALDYAHDHGVVHRDIKPENILVTAKGEVKVGDFGIARALSSAGLTATGTVLGSVSYFSPEQASGRSATAESDLYAMGMILYEMLTGKLPFTGPNPVAVAMAQVNDPPPSPRVFRPDLSPEVEAVVLKALAKDPSRRYHSGYDMLVALSSLPPARDGRRRAALASAPTVANTVQQPVAMAAAPRRPPRQGTGGALAALLTTAALLIAAVLVGRSLTTSSDHQAEGPAATQTPAQATATAQTAIQATATAQLAVAPTLTPGATDTNPAVLPTQAPPTSTAPPPTTTAPAVAIFPTATVAVDTATAVPIPASDTPVPTDTQAPLGSAGGATIDLVTSRNVGAHFAPVGITTTFSSKTQVIYAVATVHSKPAGVSVVFHWRYPSGGGFIYDNTAVAPYAGEVVGYAELNPQGPGTYSVSTSIRGHTLASVSFTVEAGGTNTSGATTPTGNT